MRPTILIVIVLNLVVSIACTGQQEENRITYSPPFDSLSLKWHQEKINRGASYLLLAKYSKGSKNGYYFINTAWFELPGNQNRCIENIDSLLNGNMNDLYSNNLIPIPEYQPDFYEERSTCDLIKESFDENGYYIASSYYSTNILILAELIRRGIQIEVSDYEGEPHVNLVSINCQ